MSILNNIKRGKQSRAQKIIIYGPEGVGKSTLAASFPVPLFLDTESGSGHLDVARLDCRSFEDVLGGIEELACGGHEFKTVVLDSVDWAERLLTFAFIREHNKKHGTNYQNIEDFGFGKGYKMVEPWMMKLLSKLDTLIEAGINVVLVGHSRRVKFEMPEAVGSYDKHELNLTKCCAPLVKEWADAMFFCNFVVSVQNGRGKGGSARLIYTGPAAPYEAKNRYDLPGSMEMSDDLAGMIFKATGGSVGVSVGASVGVSVGASVAEVAEHVRSEVAGEVDVVGVAGELGVLIEDAEGAVAYSISKGWLRPGEGIECMPGHIAEHIRRAPVRFNNAVKLYVEGGNK